MENLEILYEVIGGKRHPNYQRTVDLSQLYMKLVTGKDINTLMRQFVRRETDEQFKQRKIITQHITSTVCRNLMKPAYKIPRTNSSVRVLAYEDDTDNVRLAKFNNYLNIFWGNKTLDDWMGTRWIELNYIDPNTFAVIEWDEDVTPYPYEVSAENALYFEYDNEILQYLIGYSTFTVDVRGEQKQAKQYTMYTQDSTFVLSQTFDEWIRGYLGDENQIKTITTAQVSGDYVKVGRDEYYQVEEFVHSLGYVPAYCVGYARDLQTAGITFVSPIDEATPILMSTIKAKSELDLSIALHTFPQKIQYVKRCNYKECNRGKLPDDSICPVCRGTGLDVQTSAQEIIQLELPKLREEMIELTNIIRYEYPPVDLLKFQDEYIKSLVNQCKEAIYNSDIYSNQQIQETATGQNIDLQALYDTLYPMSITYARDWEFSVKTIADITGMTTGLIYSYTFSKDFKLKTLDALYSDLQKVSASGADSFIINSIQNDIARIIYAENEEDYLKYVTKQSFYPFSGKTPEQIMLLMSTNDTPQFYKVLWANYGHIFDDIEREQGEKGLNFYKMTKPLQWKLITEKVNAIINENQPQAPTLDFNAPVE